MMDARDSLKVYGAYRKKAKTVVEQLQQNGIKQVYIEGNDEAVDILRLTCIEAGIRLSETSNGVTMKVVGQDYQMSMED
jgi:hypothetical protein